MRLLLAEDEKALSRALTAILERNNYSVDPVYDGQAALDYLKAGNYDGIILDIMMPKVDGITVLKEIRSQGSLIPGAGRRRQRLPDQTLQYPGTAGPDSGHDPHPDCPGKFSASDGEHHPGSGHFRAVLPHRQLPAGQ